MLQQDVQGSHRCLEIKELYLELQGGVWWDDTACTCFSVSVVRWAYQDCFLALLKLTDSLVPSSNDLSNTDLELEWSSFLNRGIKHGAVHQGAVVVRGDKCALWDNWSSALVQFLNGEFLTHIFNF